jgi:hypothetical protein
MAVQYTAPIAQVLQPDNWEYPWYASCDLAFHCLVLAQIDSVFAEEQLLLLMREWYMHANGQLPAYEWNFNAANPPIQAWAAYRIYKIEEQQSGKGNRSFLETAGSRSTSRSAPITMSWSANCTSPAYRDRALPRSCEPWRSAMPTTHRCFASPCWLRSSGGSAQSGCPLWKVSTTGWNWGRGDPWQSWPVRSSLRLVPSGSLNSGEPGTDTGGAKYSPEDPFREAKQCCDAAAIAQIHDLPCMASGS